MKKTSIALSLIFFLLSVSHSYGFIENRLHWWQVRLKNLEAERIKVRAATPGSPIIGIIDRDMDRARAIIDVFEREMRHDGSLTHATRVMTGADITAEARTVVPPLCALRQLELMVRDPEGDDALAAARDAAERRINALARRHFDAESPELTKRVMADDIRADEWKVLAREVLAGSLMAGRDAFEERATREVAAAVSARLRERNGTANGRELRMLTVGAALDRLERCGAPDRDRSDAALAASWTWMKKEALIERDFAGYKKILALPGIPAGAPLERIRQYYRNPADLDPVLFRTNAVHNANEHIPSPAPAGGTTALEIPALPAEAPLSEEMGRIRRAALLTVTGREAPEFINELNARLGALIERGAEDAKGVFDREEEKARLIREKEGAGARIINEREFNDARRLFNERLASLEKSRARTVALVRIASEGKTMSGGEIATRYRYLLRRSGEYLGFAGELTAASARASSFCGPKEQKRFGLGITGVSALFRSVGSTLGIDRNDRPFLSKGEISGLRVLTTEFVASMQRTRGEIRKCSADFGRSRLTAAGAEQKGSASLREKIAQDDIDALRAHAEDCAALYLQLGYGEEMISRYAERYVSFMKEARTGAVSPELDNAVTEGSILSSIDGFDQGRIRRELAAKRYLRGRAKTALARLQTLLQFYKRSNVRVPDAPVPEEIAVIEKNIAAAPQARIDSWTMNESNMAEIDAKAARKLSLILSRKAPSPDRNSGGAARSRETRRTVTIQDPDFSFAVPARWAEETVGQTEAYEGVVKSFSTAEGGPAIKLVRLPMENDGMKETAERWIRKSGCVLIEKRWEKRPEGEYLWIIAKDGDRNISETCSLSREGFTVMLTGKASRERYPRFKASLRKIIDSIH